MPYLFISLAPLTLIQSDDASMRRALLSMNAALIRGRSSLIFLPSYAALNRVNTVLVLILCLFVT